MYLHALIQKQKLWLTSELPIKRIIRGTQGQRSTCYLILIFEYMHTDRLYRVGLCRAVPHLSLIHI